jgi:hypothetical protein
VTTPHHNAKRSSRMNRLPSVCPTHPMSPTRNALPSTTSSHSVHARAAAAAGMVTHHSRCLRLSPTMCCLRTQPPKRAYSSHTPTLSTCPLTHPPTYLTTRLHIHQDTLPPTLSSTHPLIHPPAPLRHSYVSPLSPPFFLPLFSLSPYQRMCALSIASHRRASINHDIVLLRRLFLQLCVWTYHRIPCAPRKCLSPPTKSPTTRSAHEHLHLSAHPYHSIHPHLNIPTHMHRYLTQTSAQGTYATQVALSQVTQDLSAVSQALSRLASTVNA